jgi:hypothetical protein
VSSITDNGTGDYTVNFTTAMPDANYSVGTSNYEFKGAAQCRTMRDKFTLQGVSTTYTQRKNSGSAFIQFKLLQTFEELRVVHVSSPSSVTNF